MLGNMWDWAMIAFGLLMIGWKCGIVMQYQLLLSEASVFIYLFIYLFVYLT